jgi:hypothetical protein
MSDDETFAGDCVRLGRKRFGFGFYRGRYCKLILANTNSNSIKKME